MPVLVTLTDEQKAQLPKLVNNLNFAIRNHNVGQLFTDVLAGTNTRHLNVRETGEIKRLLNLINLGTYHSKFGDLFIDLLQANAISLTQNQKDDLVRALSKLNITLTRLQFGEIAGEAISPAVKTPVGPGPVLKPSVKAKSTAPKTAKVGESLAIADLFEFTDSAQADYTFEANPVANATATRPNIKLNAPGSVTITATNSKDSNVKATATITVAAAPAPKVDVPYAQGDIKVTFAGTTGAGTATKTSTDKTGTTVAIAPTSGLSNGGSVTATVTANAGYTVNSQQSLTFSYPVSGLAAAPAPKTVNGKTLDAQVGGTAIAADDLFAYGGGANKSNVTNVTGTKTTWDDSAKTLTLDDDATGDITLTFDVAGGATKGSTAAKLTNVTAKP
ncbi:TPA: hypothetical protein ACNEJR_003640 [Escherichia coli]